MISLGGFKTFFVRNFYQSAIIMADESKRIKTDNDAEVYIGTHNGTFHCDEVVGCFMLRQLPEYKNAKILRSRDIELLRNKCDIIIDVGGEFDNSRKWYDHHQKTFQETLSSLRPELGNEFKIRLSSAGLVYTFYGERIIDEILRHHADINLSKNNLQLVFKQIYKNFILEIDAIDNGVPMFDDGVEPKYDISTSLSSRISRLNPSWDEDKQNIDEKFFKAMDVAGKEFVENVINIGKSWINAREYVREALLSATKVHESGEILLLKRFCPWKVHLANLEIEYNLVGVPKLVIFSENEQSWRIAGVPISPRSFLGRKFLPIPWRGLNNDDLSSIAGVSDLVFVHHTGFIGGAKTKESALQMAIKSIQWKD
ncbi:MYG1 exonuclease isoform X2 [Teleopsis dalmanni]|uniref:MYG1 exonuclease isoform X2 n=1 Tax=Teleopsis dalmanni TaxID=139649 RepID=UPI0018CE64ED|nr:MYG1 exonuclease isoform X2 [Teleopsis dalmanni]